jgi:hypothetical protein
MIKRSLVVGSVALFLAALITLTGCPTSTDDSSSTIVYGHRIYGTEVNPYQVQLAIDNAIKAGEPVVLENNLTIGTGDGELNFKTAQVVVNGAVTFTGGVISVADAAVTWKEGSSLKLDGSGKYIHRTGTDVSKVKVDAPATDLVDFVERREDITSTAVAVAVRRFKLGPLQDYDYSSGAPINFVTANTAALTTVYVLDELVIPTEGVAPGLTLTALGSVDVTGVPPTSVVVGKDTILLGTSSTLTSSKGGIVIPVVGTSTSLHAVEVREGKDFAIVQDSTPGALIIDKLTGKGTLEVLSAVTSITINGGDGNVTFSGDAAPTKITIGSTGKTVFAKAVASLTTDSVISGDAVFEGAVTTSASLTFHGDVTLASAAVVTLNFGTPSRLTLAAGKTVYAKITPSASGSATTIAPLLTAGPAGVALTPTSGATLTLAAAPAKADETSVNDAKKITLGDQPLEITSGVLQVAPGAVFELNDKTLTTGADPAVKGYLALENGGKVAFLSSGSLVIGDTTIKVASTLQAGGGTVTLGNDKIAGSAAGTTLAAPLKGGIAGTAPLISVAANTNLILEQVDLNLAAFGGLEINAGSGRVILTGRARIILNNGEGGAAVPDDYTNITVGANVLRLAGPRA